MSKDMDGFDKVILGTILAFIAMVAIGLAVAGWAGAKAEETKQACIAAGHEPLVCGVHP